MGLTIGNYIGIGKNSGISLSQYWAQQSEVLFFGLYSEISEGQMPNKVTGSTDFLTVAGVAGSETYQCPNTAAYIAADTDYIWFKTDTTPRTVTTAELIGYDLQRTPVKYEDESPNEIVAIIILNAAVTGTKRDRLFRDMWLPILWDNVWNDFGKLKSNRPDTAQILWTPETLYPDILDDGNTVAFYDSTALDTITKDESNLVSLWKDKLNSGHDLSPINTLYKATWVDGGGLVFNGGYKTAAFTWNQPMMIYLCVKLTAWGTNDCLVDGFTSGTSMIQQITTTPNLYVVNDSTAYVGPLTTFTINTKGVLVGLWLDGAGKSKIRLNNGTAVTGNAGAVTAGGLTLGAKGNNSDSINVTIYEVICRNIKDTPENETIIHDYLKAKYGV
jgi:hypothetical protein